MKKLCLPLFSVLIALPLLVLSTQAERSILSFNADWRFSIGDPAGAEAPTYNDSEWRQLDVPHDWAFEADYAEDAAQADRGGYKPGGIGWYRKTFELPADWKNRRISIAFDAVFMNSEVWINGQWLGKRPYGYISFDYDLTPHLVAGKNTIAVRADSQLEPAARWYHGCGIYGHVQLIATAPIHITKDGVFVQTPVVTDAQAEVSIETEVAHAGNKTAKVVLETILLDPDGNAVARTSQKLALKAGATETVKQTLKVASPKRWSPDTPHLYKAVSRISSGRTALDEIMTRFGIRTLRWDRDTGFWLNDVNTKLLGVADHSEAGPIGAAYPDELLRWKIQQLKDMGCNAIRTAHNPQTPIFYDLCDEMGMLVMDEIFDGWKRKAAEDYGKQSFDEWWERDLRAWLKRDRNHPSVFIWSLGNETRGEIASELVRVCHEMDPSRLTTSGHAGPEEMDVEGVNGHSEEQEFFKHPPEKPFVSTEAPHTWQVRGFYRTKTWMRDGPNRRGLFPCPDLTEQEIFGYDWTKPENRKNRKQVFNSSYDNAMVRITARKNWELMRDLPWHSGHFRWTGYDYLGEAGYVHGGWPFRAFMGGALDLAGFKKDLYYFYQSQWTDEPMAHILPHWTHPKMAAGTKIPVWVYSNGDEVELFLNGKSLGKDRPGTKWDEMQCEWMVPWTPGTLEAVAYRDGKEVARMSQTTADVPAQLKLEAEGDTCPIITVSQLDKNGVMNPYAENRIHYHIDGPARMLSLESGNPVNTENNLTTSRAAFFGLTRAFLQVTGEGDLSVIAGSINGEKQLMTSDVISIDVQSLALHGKAKPGSFRIFYSTDGAEPSTEYQAPFSVKPDTTVRADVYKDDQILFRMSERFGPEEGIFWGEPGSPSMIVSELQAETATFKGVKVSRRGNSHHGAGYLDFSTAKEAYVEWYQENDGSPGCFALLIRHSAASVDPAGREMELWVNGRMIERISFPPPKGRAGSWKILKREIQLESGANTIRLVADPACTLSIDDIEVK